MDIVKFVLAPVALAIIVILAAGCAPEEHKRCIEWEGPEGHAKICVKWEAFTNG